MHLTADQNMWVETNIIQDEIDKSTVTDEAFNTPLSGTDKSSKQKTRRM